MKPESGWRRFWDSPITQTLVGLWFLSSLHRQHGWWAVLGTVAAVLSFIRVGIVVTTRDEMNRRKEQVWDALHLRGPSKASEVKFQLNDRGWTEESGRGWNDAKVNVALAALRKEGRVNCWGNAWGYGRVWITVPTEVPDDLIDAIEEIGKDPKVKLLLRYHERRA